MKNGLLKFVIQLMIVYSYWCQLNYPVLSVRDRVWKCEKYFWLLDLLIYCCQCSWNTTTTITAHMSWWGVRSISWISVNLVWLLSPLDYTTPDEILATTSIILQVVYQCSITTTAEFFSVFVVVHTKMGEMANIY